MAFTSAVNTSLLTTWLVKKFIPALENELQFQKFTTKAIIPAGQGKIARFNVFSNPPGTTGALTEGATLHDFPTTLNQITTLTTTGTDVTIAEYGEWIKVSNIQEYAAVKGSREELTKRMAYGGALCIDSLVRAQAATTTLDWYAQSSGYGTGTAAIPTTNSASTVIGAAQELRNNSAQGFSGISGHTDGNLAGIFSPKAETQMVTEGTTGRLTWAQAVTNVPGMQGQQRFVKGYMGEIYGVSCYRTQNFTQTTVTSLSDNNYLLADGGIGAVAFEDMDAKIIINDVNSPYKNANSIAWYAKFATGLIDSNRVIRLYTYAV